MPKGTIKINKKQNSSFLDNSNKINYNLDDFKLNLPFLEDLGVLILYKKTKFKKLGIGFLYSLGKNYQEAIDKIKNTKINKDEVIYVPNGYIKISITNTKSKKIQKYIEDNKINKEKLLYDINNTIKNFYVKVRENKKNGDKKSTFGYKSIIENLEKEFPFLSFNTGRRTITFDYDNPLLNKNTNLTDIKFQKKNNIKSVISLVSLLKTLIGFQKQFDLGIENIFISKYREKNFYFANFQITFTGSEEKIFYVNNILNTFFKGKNKKYKIFDDTMNNINQLRIFKVGDNVERDFIDSLGTYHKVKVVNLNNYEKTIKDKYIKKLIETLKNYTPQFNGYINKKLKHQLFRKTINIDKTILIENYIANKYINLQDNFISEIIQIEGKLIEFFDYLFDKNNKENFKDIYQSKELKIAIKELLLKTYSREINFIYQNNLWSKFTKGGFINLSLLYKISFLVNEGIIPDTNKLTKKQEKDILNKLKNIKLNYKGFFKNLFKVNFLKHITIKKDKINYTDINDLLENITFDNKERQTYLKSYSLLLKDIETKKSTIKSFLKKIKDIKSKRTKKNLKRILDLLDKNKKELQKKWKNFTDNFRQIHKEITEIVEKKDNKKINKIIYENINIISNPTEDNINYLKRNGRKNISKLKKDLLKNIKLDNTGLYSFIQPIFKYENINFDINKNIGFFTNIFDINKYSFNKEEEKISKKHEQLEKILSNYILLGDIEYFQNYLNNGEVRKKEIIRLIIEYFNFLQTNILGFINKNKDFNRKIVVIKKLKELYSILKDIIQKIETQKKDYIEIKKLKKILQDTKLIQTLFFIEIINILSKTKISSTLSFDNHINNKIFKKALLKVQDFFNYLVVIPFKNNLIRQKIKKNTEFKKVKIKRYNISNILEDKKLKNILFKKATYIFDTDYYIRKGNRKIYSILKDSNIIQYTKNEYQYTKTNTSHNVNKISEYLTNNAIKFLTVNFIDGNRYHSINKTMGFITQALNNIKLQNPGKELPTKEEILKNITNKIPEVEKYINNEFRKTINEYAFAFT